MVDGESEIVERWPVTIARSRGTTRGWAPYLLGAGPTFGLTVPRPVAAGVLSPPAATRRATGNQPRPRAWPPADAVTIGEDDFGLHTQVHTQNRRQLARALSPEAQGALVRVPALRSASGDGAHVVVSVHGEPATEARALLVAAVATIARHCGGLTPAFEAAGGVIEIAPVGGRDRSAAVVFEGPGGTVRCDGIASGHDVLARARIAARTPDLATRIHEGMVADPAIASAIIPPECRDYMIAIGDATLSADGETATLVLLDPTPTAHVVRAAVALLHTLAVAGRRIGVFR